MAKKKSTKKSRLASVDWKYILAYICVPLASAVVGGLLAIGGNAYIQSKQSHQAAVKTDKEERKKIYVDFLDHANTYNSVTARAKECIVNIKEHTNSDGILSQYCNDTINDLQSARYDFQKSINEVYIYGSKDAVAKSKAVAKTLPSSLGSLTIGNTGIPPLSEVVQHDAGTINKPYRDFNTVACKELPAIPRDDCDNN